MHTVSAVSYMYIVGIIQVFGFHHKGHDVQFSIVVMPVVDPIVNHPQYCHTYPYVGLQNSSPNGS